MSLEIASGRVPTWPPAPEVPELRGPAGASEWRGVAGVLAAADELAACRSLDSLLKQAVELARERVGVERVGLYVQDPEGENLLRGTWGTDLKGQTTDEREVTHECSPGYRALLLQVQSSQKRWLYYDSTQHLSLEDGKPIAVGHGWLVVTPLVYGGELVGIMYNDSAISGAPMDEAQQIALAVLCSLLANQLASRRSQIGFSVAPSSEGDRGPVVARVLAAVNRDPLVSARSLAKEMSISAGHVTRLFRTEMGMSLVEYRNRLRIQRFFGLVEKGGDNLLAAALSAGFGSYAQFHRVFRRVVGTTPREYIVGQRGTVPPDLPGIE
jgi:AraC-like DNA-binding protein